MERNAAEICYDEEETAEKRIMHFTGISRKIRPGKDGGGKGQRIRRLNHYGGDYQMFPIEQEGARDSWEIGNLVRLRKPDAETKNDQKLEGDRVHVGDVKVVRNYH